MGASPRYLLAQMLRQRLPKKVKEPLFYGDRSITIKKGDTAMKRYPLNFYLVGMRGFEPPTPASRTQCSTRLSHIPFVLRTHFYPTA